MTKLNASDFSESYEMVLCDEMGLPVLIIGSEKFTVIGPRS